jgi:pyruvate-formate lyase-activating enzyme
MDLPRRPLRELWLHTGTACNLSCPFCHAASAPGDARLGARTPATARAAVDAALKLGVERFAFTGGEPLILRGIVEILLYAQAHRPCLVLTNGTAPLIRRPQHLLQLRAGTHPVAFRVSIDHPDEAQHDAGRGLRNFRKALQGLKLLHEAGFEVGLTRLHTDGEDTARIAARFRALLRRQGLSEDLAVVALPALGGLRDPLAPLLRSPPGPAPFAPACADSLMAAVRAGTVRYLPCPLVDDMPALELGPDLVQALERPVEKRHERCRVCHGAGVDYAGRGSQGRPVDGLAGGREGLKKV